MTKMTDDHFTANLRAVLTRLNLSRVELAHKVGIDKSAVSRWSQGNSRPTDVNLSVLTELVQQQVAGFTRDHWTANPETVLSLLGLAPDRPSTGGAFDDFLPHFSGYAQQGMARGMDRFGGIWVQFYSPMAPKPARPLFCGAVLIGSRNNHLWYDVSDGARGVWTGGGPAFCIDNKLWVLIEEYRGRSDLCAICYNGTTGQADILDGLALARAANMNGVPVTGRFTLFRLADMPPDTEKAEALYDAAKSRAGELSMNNLADRLPGWMVERLLDGVEPESKRTTHQPYILSLSEADNLTTNTLEVDFFGSGEGTRRVMLDHARALFADLIDAPQT